jgi:hypothetical protein
VREEKLLPPRQALTCPGAAPVPGSETPGNGQAGPLLNDRQRRHKHAILDSISLNFPPRDILEHATGGSFASWPQPLIKLANFANELAYRPSLALCRTLCTGYLSDIYSFYILARLLQPTTKVVFFSDLSTSVTKSGLLASKQLNPYRRNRHAGTQS